MADTRMTQLTSWTGYRFFAWAIVAGLLALGSMMLFMPDTASAQGRIRTDIEIDHSSTGFPLSGGHTQVVCERCHLQGIFRGTPTQCMQCHSPGGRVVSTFKPANHLPTSVNCNSCHRTTNWTPAFFTHNGVAPGTCSKCHNQTIAAGKTATHIPTTMTCDSCHRTVGWTGAAFKHQGVASGTCVTCHNGIQARGKPAGHMATALTCDSCHKIGAANWLLVSTGYNHTGITTGCATCHNSTTALGKAASHIPTTLGCETCHKSTTAFGPGTPMNHTGIATGCATCHGGGYTGVMTKSTTHVATAAACETCHKSTTTFTGAVFNHTGIVSGCASCHMPGGAGLAKPANHFPTVTACETCHKSTTTFSGTRMVHSGVVTTGTCNTCHERGMNWAGGIVTRPNGHTGTKGAPNSCDKSGCHNTSTFSK